MFHYSLVKTIIKKVENLVFVFLTSNCAGNREISFKSHTIHPKAIQNHVAFHKVPKMTTYFMHQYFEVMALALQTLKSYHFAFGVCSLKHDVISCFNFLTNVSLLV